MTRALASACFVSFIALSPLAHAAEVLQSRAEFDPWASAPQVEDFNAVAPTGPLLDGNHSIGALTVLNVVPAASTANFRVQDGQGNPSVDGTVQLGGQLDGSPLSTFIITFPEPVYAAGFDYAFRSTFSQGGVVRAAGVQRDFANAGDTGFVGVVSTTPFQSLELECDADSFSAFAVDNVRWSTVAPPDDDADGFLDADEGGDDCDDNDGSIFPGADDPACDGIDQDCSGDDDLADADADGVPRPECGGDDCDDGDATIFPGADDPLCDGIDQDCSGNNDLDGDGDGFAADYCGGTDCDDSNADVYAGAPEVCGDLLDNDCDGGLPIDEYDLDGDGESQCDGDCDDLDATVASYLEDFCDGIDNNCDGTIDDASSDGDGDGVCEELDPCPEDILDDSDGDGVCDSDDVCAGGDDRLDFDGDGQADACDACPLDALGDSDGDGSCDSDDLCTGDDASGDNDLDGVCADVDVCPGFNDRLDTDGNGTPDGCEPCAFDTDADADGACASEDCDDTDPNAFPGNTEICDGVDNDCIDGVPTDELDLDADGFLACQDDCDDLNPEVSPDATELCNGLDDDCDGTTDAGLVDSDGDGTCDTLDLCPDDASDDSDGDGICDSIDWCVGNDWSGDLDLDGVCSDLDPCPLDVSDDSDGDLTCDSVDLCEGDDAYGDADGDGRCDPLLLIDGVVPGGTLTANVTNAEPGSQVVLLVSVGGDDGPEVCHPTAPVCTTLRNFLVVQTGTADGGGEFSTTLTVPGSLSAGTTLWFQAVWLDGGQGQSAPVVEVTASP